MSDQAVVEPATHFTRTQLDAQFQPLGVYIRQRGHVMLYANAKIFGPARSDVPERVRAGIVRETVVRLRLPVKLFTHLYRVMERFAVLLHLARDVVHPTIGGQ